MTLESSLSSHLAGAQIKLVMLWSLISCLPSLTLDCAVAADPHLQIEPFAAFHNTETDPEPLFEQLVSKRTGVDFSNPIDTYHPRGDLYHASYACGGIAIGDVDGDGLPDIFLAGTTSKSKFYRNLGDFQFEDVTRAANVAGGDVWSTGAAMADVDGDGDLDIYVCNHDAPNYLYINNGQGSFTEQAERFGLATQTASLMAYFCDYDRDGDLDMYLIAYRYYRPNGRPKSVKVNFFDGKPVLTPEFAKYYTLVSDGTSNYANWTYTATGCPDHLYRNDNGRFTDVSEAAGLNRDSAFGNSATWWDYDNDGWFDLYVGNDFEGPDWLYKNNGDGTFSEVLRKATPQSTWYTMGTMTGDLNNDGWPDLVAADMGGSSHYKSKMMMGDMSSSKRFLDSSEPRQHMRNCAFIATGTERLLEAGHMVGLAKTDWTWSVRLADFDNDGWIDAFFPNGVVRDFMNSDRKALDSKMFIGKSLWLMSADEPTLSEQNFAYRNDGQMHFCDVSKEWGLDFVGMSYVAGLGDLDRDGDVDLLVANMDDQVLLYRNRASKGNRISVRLRGRDGNTQGIGATIRIETDEGVRVRQNLPQQGFISSDEPRVHIGLQNAEKINQISVTWADGTVQTFVDLPANCLVTVSQSEASAPADSKPSESPLFVKSDMLRHIRHLEYVYDDFSRQPLLPNKMSQLGPGMAWGDADGDGDDDLYVSGALGRPGELHENLGAGNFAPVPIGAFIEDKHHEDMGAMFFDADADGDLDLYVVSGGGEMEAGADLLQDRLYVNDGNAEFTLAADDALPQLRESGSFVGAADYDRDGDLDLFVAARFIPGEYPTTPRSALLRNDNGQFTDVTDEEAVGLRRTGLVTGAVWSDANGDGWVDLLVTHEWGPVKYFENRQGKLVDSTVDAKLSALTGWWNGIDGGDIDNDGDVDYLVTNFGLNTKYKASEQSPCLIYYTDFEKSGHKHLVEAGFENNMLLPRRGRSCSSQAMPFLAEKFPTYHQFAVADLLEIYTPECLDEALKLSAVNLKSGVLINDGSARFHFAPLPPLAQIAPGFGCLLTEVDGDGVADACIAQNFYHAQRETARMAGGLGLLLRGNGDGTFDPVWPAQSGLSVQEDATALTQADLNGDGWTDFVVAVNDGPVHTFLRNPVGAPPPLRIKLKGRAGNPDAIGARVTVEFDGLPRQHAEVRSGSGYLGQSSRVLVFARPSGKKPRRIEVRWPDGETSEHAPKNLQGTVTLGR